VNVVIAGALFQCLASPCAVCVDHLTLTLYCAVAKHFCVIVLFEYTCDMDHESDAKILLLSSFKKAVLNMQYMRVQDFWISKLRLCFREDKLEVLQTYQHQDPHDAFEREPYVVHFRTLNSNGNVEARIATFVYHLLQKLSAAAGNTFQSSSPQKLPQWFKYCLTLVGTQSHCGGSDFVQP